jgi:hypothetical protein
MNETKQTTRQAHDWPEATAITVALGFFALLVSGWVDPMLPWMQ